MAVATLTITSRQPFAQGMTFGNVGAYEQVDGIAHLLADPQHPANALITDLTLAPRDSRGLVHYTTDFRMLRPVEAQRGNHRLLFDIVNRGRPLALRNLNSAPDVPAQEPLHPGNGFLMRQGYTVAWCGWQFDAPAVPGSMRLYPPEAVTPEGPVAGKVVSIFQLHAPAQVQMLANRLHRPYLASDLDDPEAMLTEQDHEDASERIIPRAQWCFARVQDGQVLPDASYVYRPAGFLPGKIYQVIYRTSGAPIVGLGLAATRDVAAFLRYGTRSQGNPCAEDVVHAYAFGVSQSGRFLRVFLHQGMNQDEHDRMVFDGVMPHVAGGKHGEFNQRFAQPSSQASRSANNLPPFSDSAQTDPETGRSDGLLTRLTSRGQVPKVMHTYTSSEYWAGHGALVHIDLTGTRDLPIPDAVRVYHFGGTQHSLGPFELTDRDAVNGFRAQQAFNWIDYRPLLRAALVNLDRWVSTGEAPPASRYPRLDDGTAIPPETLKEALQALPGVHFPQPLRQIYRLDFGPQPGVATNVPVITGKPYPCLVPALDQDGNERCGIRLPFHTVPLATYTGWNLRHADSGGEGQILSSGGGSGGTLLGATVPFPATPQARERARDPRLSIAERYASKEDYVAKIQQAAQTLRQEGYVLEEDVAALLTQAAQHYDQLRNRS